MKGKWLLSPPWDDDNYFFSSYQLTFDVDSVKCQALRSPQTVCMQKGWLVGSILRHRLQLWTKINLILIFWYLSQLWTVIQYLQALLISCLSTRQENNSKEYFGNVVFFEIKTFWWPLILSDFLGGGVILNCT